MCSLNVFQYVISLETRQWGEITRRHSPARAAQQPAELRRAHGGVLQDGFSGDFYAYTICILRFIPSHYMALTIKTYSF